MGVVIRQSIKASIVSYFGAAIGAITIIVVFPYFLQPDQIGLIRVITEGSSLFALFSMLGINNAFVKFYPENVNNSLGKFMGFSILVILSGFMLYCVAYWIFTDEIISFYAERSSLVNEYFIYIIPLTFIFLAILFLEIYSAQRLRIVFPKIIHEIFIRCLTIILVLAFSFFTLSLNTFIDLFIIIYLIALFALFFYVKKLSFQYPEFKISEYIKDKSRVYFSYMIVMFVYNISMAVATRADMFIITSKLSLKDTGIYSIAFFIAAFIEIPTRAVVQIATPLVSKALNENNYLQLSEYYKKISINQLLISSLIFIVLWINIDALYAIMPNGKIYEIGKYVILFLGISKIVTAATSVNAIIMSYSKYYALSILFVFLLAIFSIISNLIFIPIWGLMGAAFATFLSLLIYSLVMVYFVWLKFNIVPFSLKTIYALIIIGLCLLGITYCPLFVNLIIGSIIKTLLGVILFLFLVFKFKVSEDFNNIITQFLKFRKFDDFFRFLMPK